MAAKFVKPAADVSFYFENGDKTTISRVVSIEYDSPGTCGNILVTSKELNGKLKYHRMRESAVSFYTWSMEESR